MQRRNVSIDAIESVLKNYHTSRPAPRREGALSAVIYIGEYEGRSLKVYVERDSDPPKVTTVAWEGA